MIIRKESVISGITRARDIPINPNDWALYNMGNVSIDDAMPYLNQEDREYILSGITPDEWVSVFKEVDMNDINI